MDATFLDRSIKHITDEDLFSSLKSNHPGLKGVRVATAGGEVHAAGEAWRTYLLSRLRKAGSGGNGQRSAGDRDAILREADLVVARDIKCWGGVRIQYDGEIDFSRNLGGSSNYGFHYFGWIHPLATAYRYH